MIVNMRYFALVITLIALGCSGDDTPSSDNPDPTDPKDPVLEHIFLADPTIFYEDGTYYLYGTSQGNLESKGLGFLVFTSSNLTDWEGPSGNASGFALRVQGAFGSQGFWAPQILKYNDMHYMAYTANEKIGIATGNSPAGPFTNSGTSIDDSINQIDPFIFIDDDGKKYLYHVRFNNGNRIYVAELNDDLGSIKEETLTEVISAEEQWENTQNLDWPVAEGATVFKENGIYYLIYSANDFRNPDYAVGYATSDNPFGPWEKSDLNPIIHGDDIGESGVGHGDLFRDENNSLKYVLHTHFSSNAVHPRMSGIIELEFVNGELIAKPETFELLERLVD